MFERFRWVVCQLDALRKCLKVDAVRKALKTLPKDLDATYDRILNSIEKDYREEAFSVLQWLAFSAHPMRLEEIAEATSMAGENHPVFKPENRLSEPTDVLTICTGLVTRTDRKGRDRGEPDTVTELRLAHFSVKEYLLSPRISANFRIEEIPANLWIAKTCLAYLLHFDSDLVSEEDFVDYPLLQYAANCWPVHIRAIPDGSVDPLLNSMTLELFNPDKPCFLNWSRLYDQERRLPGEVMDQGSPLYYASYLGLCNVTRALISRGMDVNAQGGQFGNPLQAAAGTTNGTVVQILLDAGADVNAQGGFHAYALQAAVVSRSEIMVQLLLDAGADVNAQEGSYGNALQTAVTSTRSRTMIQLLLDAGADANAQGGELGTALQVAACLMDTEVVQSMLDARADVNARGGLFLGNALQVAAGLGKEAMVQLMLDAGADVNAGGGRYGSPLDCAIRDKRQLVIDLLRANGAKTSAELQSECKASWLRRDSASRRRSYPCCNRNPTSAESTENNTVAAIWKRGAGMVLEPSSPISLI